MCCNCREPARAAHIRWLRRFYKGERKDMPRGKTILLGILGGILLIMLGKMVSTPSAPHPRPATKMAGPGHATKKGD